MSLTSAGICVIQIWCVLWSEEEAEGVNVGGVACWLLYEEGSWTELRLCLGYCISNEGVTEFQFLGTQVYSTEDCIKMTCLQFRKYLEWDWEAKVKHNSAISLNLFDLEGILYYGRSLHFSVNTTCISKQCYCEYVFKGGCWHYGL